MDFLSKAKRSALMATIRSRRNKSTELALVKTFRLHGITGWRRHVALPGRPDFIFPKNKLAVFVDGCFWHGCPKHSRHAIKSGEFWRKKLDLNKARDRRVTSQLRLLGWRVVRLWEHELAKGAIVSIGKIESAIRAPNRA